MCEIWEKWVSQIKNEGEKMGIANGQISACRDFGKTREETAAYIIEKLHLTPEQAEKALLAYW